jgi:hypothetical protein
MTKCIGLIKLTWLLLIDRDLEMKKYKENMDKEGACIQLVTSCPLSDDMKIHQT